MVSCLFTACVQWSAHQTVLCVRNTCIQLSACIARVQLDFVWYVGLLLSSAERHGSTGAGLDMAVTCLMEAACLVDPGHDSSSVQDVCNLKL